MIILRKVKSNNKLLDVYFKIVYRDDVLKIEIAPNQNIIGDIYLPCVNYYNAIYHMKVHFPLEFKIFNYNDNKFILNDRFMEFAFNSCDVILDFIHPIIKKLELKMIKEDELKDNDMIYKILETIQGMENTEYMKYNKSGLILYRLENYTNKIIRESNIKDFISREDIDFCNNFRNTKLCFKMSNEF